jgi:glutathione S-transferase
MGILSNLLARVLGFSPEVRRPADEQRRVDAETARLALYHFTSCPYCIKVRRGIGRLALRIELRDIRRHPAWGDELTAGGGKGQVPCLRIEDPHGTVRWLYESDDIVRYLERRFRTIGTLQPAPEEV